MSHTRDYYETNAQQFIAGTANVDMQDLYKPFLQNVASAGHILDAGCGSGRDALAFKRLGYQVTAFDISEKLAAHASQLLQQPVSVKSFSECDDHALYDGVWACASLLHVPAAEQAATFARLWNALKPGGVLYCSFKVGSGERIYNGRHFTDATAENINAWTEGLPNLLKSHYWVTDDQRSDRNEKWLNGLLFKSANKLISGGRQNPFFPHLCAAIHRANEIDFAVAFVKITGLRLLLADLLEALKRKNDTGSLVTLRFLTSDYLDVTDPEALRLLMLLKEQGADVRIYETQGSSFHLKAYLFSGTSKKTGSWGIAFIGSSNISRQALTDGLEWNYQINYPGDSGFLESRQKFERLFSDEKVVRLSDSWIDGYESRRVKPVQSFELGSTESDPPPTPTSVQLAALNTLSETREKGYQRGLVVLATGLGKTWLSAFDAKQMGARRILFVAHREEILNQAAATFSRIKSHSRVGFYRGQQRDIHVDVLCASIQTIGKSEHLERFKPQHFDYIVVDEFHHAAAPTYHRLLNYFVPLFMLGLTATPDRTDNANILSLCDDNLVFEGNLFSGVSEKLLVPFHYYGVFDDVNYQSIPWRNGRFDPEVLSNKLATLGRAKHALSTWRLRAQAKTLAFCISTKHADFMADYFARKGVKAAAVYASSELSRGEALEMLRVGDLEILFSVDLFNEGVDLPEIDTVMMLRPTESKILFLQQLGRGLRKSNNKQHLVVLDFVANHQSFLHKPMALMNQSMTHKQLSEFARRSEHGKLDLPDGCFVNYDLKFIEFLKSLESDGLESEYRSLRDTLGRRPKLVEFYHAGASIQNLRRQYGHWFSLIVQEEADLESEFKNLSEKYSDFWQELMVSNMTKSYKMVLLEAFQELDGWRQAPNLEQLSARSWSVIQRRRTLLMDLPEEFQRSREQPDGWIKYWKDNPIKAWCNRGFFSVEENLFIPRFLISDNAVDLVNDLVQELIDYRLATYQARSGVVSSAAPSVGPATSKMDLPYFPNLKIACGHFKTGRTDIEEYRSVDQTLGQFSSEKHFIARASGNSMNGGKNPIRDGDYLLLELISSEKAGKITDSVLAIERQDEAGDNQYLLRRVLKDSNGQYRLRAYNPDYEDIQVTDELKEQFRTFARLKTILDPFSMVVGKEFMREEIPALFNTEFNAGSWNSGHIVIPQASAHVLLVTLNKQGKSVDLRYQDHWIDDRHFHWQTQNSTSPEGKRGREIIQHEKLGIGMHLFVRENKLRQGKAAPFVYYGRVNYQRHEGSKPMSVTFELVDSF